MKNLIKVVLLLIMSLTYCCVPAQEKKPEDIVDNFFKLYESNELGRAFDNLFSSNQLITEKDVKVIKDRVTQYANVLGNYHGHKLFIKESVSDIIEVHSYILKYDTQPVRFVVTFYKPNNNWKIQNFKINDDFIDEIEKATLELGYKKKR